MRVLLVDDERLARVALRRMLKTHDDVIVVGEAANAEQAEEQILRLRPELVFLDVEMPGKSGLQLLEALEELPGVIFITAYQEYAVQAFEVSAVDYLMKPVSPERLALALAKVRKQSSRDPKPARSMLQIFLQEGGKCWIVATEKIQVFESVGNYTRVYFDDNRPLVYRSLNALESRLDPASFVRASRSHILNLRAIKSVHPSPDGGLTATLGSGISVRISRRQARKLRELLSL